MHASQFLNVLVVALSTLGAAQALNIAPEQHGGHAGQVVRRQKTTIDSAATAKTTDGSNSSPTPTTPLSSTKTPPATTTLPPTTSKPTVETTPTTTKPETSETPETTPPTTTSPSPSSTPLPTTRPSSTSPPPSSTTTSTAPNSSSTTAKVVVSTSTMVVTTTGANGQSTTYTSEQVSTSTPDLATTSSSGSKGMTPQTRNTVIGVVVGVGGAIVLAGIAFLALRLYRKKQPEDSDGLMEYNNGFAAADKSEVASSNSQSGRSPFQSTLESYHAPTQVNTASNF